MRMFNFLLWRYASQLEVLHIVWCLSLWMLWNHFTASRNSSKELWRSRSCSSHRAQYTGWNDENCEEKGQFSVFLYGFSELWATYHSIVCGRERKNQSTALYTVKVSEFWIMEVYVLHSRNIIGMSYMNYLSFKISISLEALLWT